MEHSHAFIYKLRFVFGGIFAVIASLLLILLLSAILRTSTSVVSGDTGKNTASDVLTYQGPNAVADGLTRAANQADAALDSSLLGAEAALHATATRITKGFANTGRVFKGAYHFALYGSYTLFKIYANYMAYSITGSFTYSSRGVGFVAHSVNNSPAIVAVLRPTAQVASVPVITPITSAALNGRTAIASAQPAATATPATAASSALAWPIHGTITTLFGVPHWPYQATHTGIDISDGYRSGVTPIRPIKPGTVIEVVHSNVSLGNHVVVDHGNGMTSTYGHMYSTAVAVGQIVDQNSTLGLEGSTGASTGPHVHLEIRINGTLVNPLNYLPPR